MTLSEKEYEAFPKSHEVMIKVLNHYQSFIFDGDYKHLNESQNVLSYSLICEGMINNGGIYSILLESFGEYNTQYATALKLIGDSETYSIWEQVIVIMDSYKESFMEQVLPPELDDESELFNDVLSKKIDYLENRWYALAEHRTNLLMNYLHRYKSSIITTTA